MIPARERLLFLVLAFCGSVIAVVLFYAAALRFSEHRQSAYLYALLGALESAAAGLVLRASKKL